ncbi:MAG: DUF1679 domain-containing protein [Deltaproteobacteria bacterium]|nr:DUF1679 domain-containing protein [Deltaproteobacteria bacterium]MBN2672427.1 DUF1679 domain-containing protein [Deltaproteobacteria bacterium]
MRDSELKQPLKRMTGATDVIFLENIQRLWSGYGQIIRVKLPGAMPKDVVVKHVRYPTVQDHPLGWQSDLSHRRKVRSYQVETVWYTQYSHRCDSLCRVPECVRIENHDDDLLMILGDLDAAGFSVRKYRLAEREVSVTLRWLANFHATFMGTTPEGLWPIGTYWHLDTRPDELANMSDAALRNAAASIDEKLNKAEYQTLVHGDAKVANFCYSKRGQDVAAVDFQYVGGGCGMKDVAYFLGSCMHEDECERRESEKLEEYFGYLRSALAQKRSLFSSDAIEREWRELYHWAWVDFHRFMKGWSNDCWSPEDYSERLAKRVLDSIHGQKVE